MNNIQIRAGTIQLSASNEQRANWLPFKGTCLFADKPSDGVPCGSDKPVLFPAEVLANTANTLVDMAVNCEYDDLDTPEDIMAGHNPRNKIGVIKKAQLVNGELQIEGGLWCDDFYGFEYFYNNVKSSLGFSVECWIATHDDGENNIVDDCQFTGVAMLFKNVAACKDTYIAAKRKDTNMNKEEMQALLKPINDSIESIKAELSTQIHEELKAQFAEYKKEVEEKEKAKAKLAEQKAKEAKEAEEKAKLEAEEKAKAEEAEKAKIAAAEQKKKEEEDNLRKSKGYIIERFEFSDTDKAKKINDDPNLTPSQKFQALLNM